MGMVKMDILQYNIYLVNLDPTIGHEIKKTRPCLVISPDEMNRNIETVIIAPMTTKSHKYPTRIPVTLFNKKGWIVLDQIRTIDSRRIIKKTGKINNETIIQVKNTIREMLVD
jgi:mRNA interferase MazF